MAVGTGLFVFSNIYSIDNIVKNVGISHGKTLLIDTLKECFARCDEYHYVTDIFGYAKTPSQAGLDTDSGIEDDETTRIQIGTTFRYEQGFLPAISVRQTNSVYHPISFNQNKWNLEYSRQRTEDGYGNVDWISVPSKYVFSGAWDQSFEIKIISKSQEDTSAIADIVMVSLQHTYRDILEKNGIFVKQISAGGESTESINSNDPIFTVSIVATTFSEWRRELNVSNLLERIQVCFSVDLGSSQDQPASGLGIKWNLDL